ncbi:MULTISPECIES: SH3 domain-containing protein [Sphingobium]|uniref:SH3 domain-containing protein n=1 Tax=Sphingobium TaxID=165695 RepID=UPI00159CAB0F|nr:SH3 domain-containing protein [Sphingobium sp. 15-1]
MRAFMLMASVAALAVPLVSLAPAAQAQSGWSRHGRTSTGYTLRQVRMWAGPDTDYPVIRFIPGNRRVDIYGCLNNWSWCDVGYRSDRGWVAGRLLGADYRGRRQSIIMIAPYMSILVLSFRFDDYWDNHYRSRPFYSDRSRWESHYYDNYRPEWGPRPTTPDRYRRGNDRQRPQMAPGRRESGYRDQPANSYRRDATPQAVPTPDRPNVSPGAMRNRDQRPWEATPRAQGRNDSAAAKHGDAEERARRKAEAENMRNNRQ